MQIRKINSKHQSGMALILTLIAVLILTLIATALLQSQNVATKAHNQFIDSETGTDAVDFCTQAAFEQLANDNLNNTLSTDPTIVVPISASQKILNAFTNANTKISKNRLSNIAKIQPSCELQFIKEELSSTANASGEEISSSRNYGASNGTYIKYYRVKAIQDNSSQRIEYQMVLAL